MDPKETLKHALYHPQPLNYKRVSGNERMFYEWLLASYIVTDMHFNKDTLQLNIKYRLW